MLVELEQVANVEVESYLVRVVEEDGKGAVVIGAAKRISDSEFAFAPLQDKEQEKLIPNDVSIVLQAKDKAELKQVIATRFGSIEIPADRLRIATMEGFAETVLLPLNALAANTGSMPGFAAALAKSVARMIVEDIKPGTEDTFKTQFMANVEEHVETMRRMGKLRENVNAALGSLFKNLSEHEDDGGPTTH